MIKIPVNKEERLEWLYTGYGKRLTGFAIKNYHLNEDQAWDVTYKTLYKLNDTLPNYTFESDKKLNGFIFTSYINYLRNFLRDKKDPDLVYDVTITEKNEIESTIEESPLMKRLNEELEKLEDWERILLLMRSQDMPYSAISTIINKPEKQLKVYFQRLKARIEKKLSTSVLINKNEE